MTTTKTYWQVHWLSKSIGRSALESLDEDIIIPSEMAVFREFDNYEDAMQLFDRLPGPAWVITTTETKWEISRKGAPEQEVT